MASCSGACETSLQRLIDQHKGAAKKKLSIPKSVKELQVMLLVDMKVSRMAVRESKGTDDLIDLYVKQLSIEEMKELLKVYTHLRRINRNNHICYPGTLTIDHLNATCRNNTFQPEICTSERIMAGP